MTLSTTEVFNLNTVTDGSVPLRYFVRSLVNRNMEAYFVPTIEPAGSLLYLPVLSASSKTSLEWGVQPVAGQPGYWKAYVFHQEALVLPEVIINGRRVSLYNGSAATAYVQIGLADGTYTNDAGATVTVLNGTILASSLPLTFGYITYVAVQVPNLNPALTVVNITPTYTFAQAVADYNLNKVTRFGYDATLTLSTPINGGAKKDTYIGSGNAYYSDGKGGTVQIVFP